MTLPLSDLAAFATIARERNLRTAARKHGVPPSSLSASLRSLEQRLGVRFLNRHDPQHDADPTRRKAAGAPRARRLAIVSAPGQSGAGLDWEVESDGETLVISPSGPLVANVIEMEVVLRSPVSSAPSRKGSLQPLHVANSRRSGDPSGMQSPNSADRAQLCQPHAHAACTARLVDFLKE
ncbi:helix-turn-helix domain-containing protein [Rhizobium yanglingense]